MIIEDTKDMYENVIKQNIICLFAFQLGMFDINPGKCKDSIAITDNANTIEITAEIQNNFRDSTVVSSGKFLSVTLKSCFQMSVEQLEKAFEIRVTSSGTNHQIVSHFKCVIT